MNEPNERTRKSGAARRSTRDTGLRAQPQNHKMATLMAASAAAVAFAAYLKQWAASAAEAALETHQRVSPHRAPQTATEAVFYFREAARHLLTETLGRWSTLDLFFGLAYLARREPKEYPALDVAAIGVPVAETVPWPTQGVPQPAANATTPTSLLHADLVALRRYLLICQGMRHRTAEMQRRHWFTHLAAIAPDDVIAHRPAAGLLRPAYAVVADRATRAIVLAVRGTHSRKDMLTNLTGAAKPHHVVVEPTKMTTAAADDGEEDKGEGEKKQAVVVLGHAHLGMLSAAMWLERQVAGVLERAVEERNNNKSGDDDSSSSKWKVVIVGHSAGAAIAALLTLLLRERHPPPSPLAAATCFAVACPAVVTRELAEAASGCVTSLANGTDVVPTFSTAAVDGLRREVLASRWFAEFRGEVAAQAKGAAAGAGQALAAPLWGCVAASGAAAVPPASASARAAFARAAAERPGGLFAAADELEALLVSGEKEGGGGGGGGGQADAPLPPTMVPPRAVVVLPPSSAAARDGGKEHGGDDGGGGGAAVGGWSSYLPRWLGGGGASGGGSSGLLFQACRVPSALRGAPAVAAPAAAAVDADKARADADADAANDSDADSQDDPDLAEDDADGNDDAAGDHVPADEEQKQRHQEQVDLAASLAVVSAAAANGGDEEEGEEEEPEAPATSATSPRAARLRPLLLPMGRLLHLVPAAALRAAQQQDGSAAAATTTAAAAAAAAGPSVLLSIRDADRASVYGRVRLCRTMLQDHFIPAYLRSLDSVLAAMEARDPSLAQQRRRRREEETATLAGVGGGGGT